MMTIAVTLLLVRQKERVQREEEVKKGRTNSSHRSNSVKGVGCEEQEKTWTVEWGSTAREGQRWLSL